MIWLIGAALYTTAGFIVACRIATLLAWHWMTDWNREWASGPYRNERAKTQPNGDQWCGGGAIGCLCGAIWPLVLIAMAAQGVLFRPPERVRIDQQEHRIAELERELEIR